MNLQPAADETLLRQEDYSEVVKVRFNQIKLHSIRLNYILYGQIRSYEVILIDSLTSLVLRFFWGSNIPNRDIAVTHRTFS